jgi:hypothetical protein
MDSKTHNPGANIPRQRDEEPRGDRGQGDKTWAPDPGEQGISNRPDDEARPLSGGSVGRQSLTHDDVIEDDVEREENRNAENDVQEDTNTRRARRRGATR